jgi:hypothetical protein
MIGTGSENTIHFRPACKNADIIFMQLGVPHERHESSFGSFSVAAAVAAPTPGALSFVADQNALSSEILFLMHACSLDASR